MGGHQLQTFRVTVPSLDIIERAVEARTGRNAALKLLSSESKSSVLNEPIEVHVRRPRGPDLIFSAVLSFRLKKAAKA
jgi:hypothetical protein